MDSHQNDQQNSPASPPPSPPPSSASPSQSESPPPHNPTSKSIPKSNDTGDTTPSPSPSHQPPPNNTDNTASATAALPSKTENSDLDWRRALYAKGIRYSLRLCGWSDNDFKDLIETGRRLRREALQKEIRDRDDDGGGGGGGLPRNQNNNNSDSSDGLGLAPDDRDAAAASVLQEDIMEQVGFGIMGTLADNATEYLWNMQDPKDADDTQAHGDYAKETKSLFSLDDNADDIRDMKLYTKILNSVKYQRDHYIMGHDYATQREKQRETNTIHINTTSTHTTTPDPPSLHLPNTTTTTTTTTNNNNNNNNNTNTNTPPIDPNSLAKTHLTPILRQFIPSPTVHAAALPHLLYQFTPPLTPPHNLPEGAPLHRITKRNLIDLMPLSRGLMDDAVKYGAIDFFSKESNREWVKASAAGGMGSNSDYR